MNLLVMNLILINWTEAGIHLAFLFHKVNLKTKSFILQFQNFNIKFSLHLNQVKESCFK